MIGGGGRDCNTQDTCDPCIKFSQFFSTYKYIVSCNKLGLSTTSQNVAVQDSAL